ncbi:hypothetical protein MASR2M117_16050 [Paludibacter sp.]
MLSSAHDHKIPKVTNDSTVIKDISEVNVHGVRANKLNFPFFSISKEDIASNNFCTASEALLSSTGIALTRDGIWATSVRIRGLSDSKIIFLADGDRIQSSTDIAGMLSSVDLNSIEEIEVIKGSGSVMYGTGAMGGVVNFVSKRAGYSPQLNFNGNFTIGFSTVNNLWSNHLNVNIQNKEWYLTLNGSYRKASDIMTPQGIMNNSQFNDASWGLLGGISRTDNQEILFSYNHFEAWDVGLPGGNAFPANALVRYLGFERNQFSGEYLFTDLTHNIKTLSIKAYTQSIKRDVENLVSSTQAIFPGSTNTTSGLKAVADLYFNDYETMIVGVEGWSRNQQTYRMKILSSSDTTIIKEQPTPRADMLDIGAFAQHKWVIEPNKLSMNTGIRLDFINTNNDTAFKEIDKYKYVNGVKTQLMPNKQILFAKGTQSQVAYSAHIDFEYKPEERNKFIFSLSNAYRVASMEERFKFIDQSGTPRVGNPNLKPEKGLFANLNYEYLGKKIFFKSDIFTNYLFDLIAEKPDTITGMFSFPTPVLLSSNIDRAFFTGGELELRWLITDKIGLETHASYVYAVDLKTKQHLPLIPPLNGNFTFNYQINNKISTYIATDWDYETRDINGKPKNTSFDAIFNIGFHTEPFTLKQIDIQFTGGIENILNKEHEEPLSTFRGINKLEPGRNFFIKTKLLF